LVLLDRYPQIQDDLEEEAVIGIFFNHLQPTSLATFMKSLKCKSIKKATEALRNKMKRKDIASAEESKFTKSSNTTNNSDKTKKCINCENSKKADSNHSIWKCSNINYCYKCRSKHLAFGPECPHKDIKIFNYDSYLEKQNKKQDPSTVSTSTFKKKTQANLVNQNCPIVQQPTLTQNNLPGNMAMDVNMGRDILRSLDKLQRQLDEMSVSEVNRFRKLVNSNTITNDTIFIDTGANETCLSNPKHSNSPVIFNRKDPHLKESIQVADGHSLEIEGKGTLLNHESSLVSSFKNTLLSISQTTCHNNAIAIFTEQDCHIVKLNKKILQILYNLLDKAKLSNNILLNGRIINGLYVCGMEDIKNISSEKQCSLRYSNTNDTNLLDTINIPSHFSIHFAGSSYYANIPSVHFQSIKEMVRYFHETWNHASAELMSLIVKHPLILNLPKALTKKAIRKHFPNCDSCPTGNLQQRPFLSLPVERVIKKGTEWEFDLIGPMTDRQGKKCPSFSGMLYALNCKDLGSKKRFGFLLRNKGYLLKYLKQIILECRKRKVIPEIFRIDKDLLTEEIETYCAEDGITLLPCIPHEHATLGDIEGDNRRIKENIMKVLANKPHLNEKYWAMAYCDIMMKNDLMPCPDDQSTNAYERWYGKKYDQLEHPCVPFGSIVKAHIPLKLQKKGVRDKSIDTIYVGLSKGKHGGILLFNPITKHTIVRRSFKIMGPIKQGDSELCYEAGYELDGAIYYNDDTTKDVQLLEDYSSHSSV